MGSIAEHELKSVEWLIVGQQLSDAVPFASIMLAGAALYINVTYALTDYGRQTL